MGRKATLAEVAAAAGVSISTVDRVINGRGGVSARKEQLVLDQARKLDLRRPLDFAPLRAIRIGVLMQAPSDPFYAVVRAAFGRANQLYGHLNTQCLLHYFDMQAPDRMAALIETVARSHDGLVVIAYENPVVVEALRSAAARIPVITLVSDLPHSGRTAYVGLDNRSAGRVAGELMARFLGKGGGDIMVLSGLRSFVGHEEREMGFRAVLAERFPECRVAKVAETRESRVAAGDLVRAALRDNPAIAGIYNISTGNQAIAAALRGLARAEHTVFIAHELTPGRRQLLREGVLDAIIDQNPETEAITAVETLLHRFGRIETAPARTITPFYIYIRENA